MLNFTAHGLRISEPWSWWTAGGGGGWMGDAVYWCLTNRKWFRMFTVQAFSLVQLWQHVGSTPFACTNSCSRWHLAHLICHHGASEIFVFKNMPWKCLCHWISCLSPSLWLSNRLQANPLTLNLRIKQTQKTWSRFLPVIAHLTWWKIVCFSFTFPTRCPLFSLLINTVGIYQ